MTHQPGLPNCVPCLFGNAHPRQPRTNCIVPGKHARQVRPDEGRSSGRNESGAKVAHRAERNHR